MKTFFFAVFLMLFTTLFALPITVYGQILTRSFPTQAIVQEQTRNASVIVEAHWLKFYRIMTKDSLSYAVYEVKVFKLFKGKISTDTLSVVSYCHRAENTAERCAAGLWRHTIGVFFLHPTDKFNNYIDSKYPQFQFISPFNGFIEEFEEVKPEWLPNIAIYKQRMVEYKKQKDSKNYNYLKNLHLTIANNHKIIEKTVGKKAKVYYDIFSGKHKQKMSRTNKYSDAHKSASQAPIITSFSPISLPGGYLDNNTSLLTIQGSGFGTISDRVYFTNAKKQIANQQKKHKNY